jgi:hypothetical protein
VEEVQKDCCSGVLRGNHECRSLPNSKFRCQKNNKLVWDEAIRIMMDMFDNVWGDRSEVVVDHCMDVTLPVRSLWLRRYSCPNIFTRLPSSSSASQVVYAVFRP